jgi:hypothetical protein
MPRYINHSNNYCWVFLCFLQPNYKQTQTMKTLRFLLSGALALATLFTAQAQTADEIINKHIEAIGGAANWKKVNSVITAGSLTVQGAEVSITSTIVHNKGARQDISVMGMSGYTIVSPTAGWNLAPWNGQTTAEAMTAEDVKESQDQLDAQGTLIDYKTKGHTVESLGTEDIEGTECHKLKITLKSGKTETIYLDPKSFYMVRMTGKQKANGQEVEVTTTFANYQKLPEGIVIPMSVTLPFGEMTVSKVEINKPVDESIFKG